VAKRSARRHWHVQRSASLSCSSQISYVIFVYTIRSGEVAARAYDAEHIQLLVFFRACLLLVRLCCVNKRISLGFLPLRIEVFLQAARIIIGLAKTC
jgi:hypothetical protein